MTSGDHHDVDAHSDVESSFSDALSPTDGYFSSSNQPSAYYVEGPGQASSSSDASDNKMAEAQRRQTNPSHAGYASRLTANTTPAVQTDMTPLLGAHEAPPPAYSAAISTPLQPQQTTTNLAESFGMDNAMHSNAVADPRSMTDDSYNWDERQRRYSKRRFCTGRAMSKLVIAGLGFCLIIWLMMARFAINKGSKGSHDAPTNEKKPKDSFYSDWPYQCQKPAETQHASFQFSDGATFKLTEMVASVEKGERRIDSLDGKIQLLQGDSNQKDEIKVDVFMAASEPWALMGLRYDQNPEGIVIKRPKLEQDGSAHERLCLRIEIDVYIAKGLSLENLGIHSQLLPIIIKSLDANMNDTTTITSKVGSVRAELFSSRKTYIDVGVGSVHGDYALRDVLSIKTTSGSIHTTVHPKDEDKDDPAPADLMISTWTGSAKIDTIFDNLPERDYLVKVSTGAGSLKGSFVHGLRTSLSSGAGSIRAKLLPAAKKAAGQTTLDTSSSAGSTGIKVLSPVHGPAPIIRSNHEATAGSLHLKYPQEWEGKIKGESRLGRVHVRGKDVKFIKKTRSSVEAEKGDDSKSEIRFKGVSGSVDLLVGNEH